MFNSLISVFDTRFVLDEIHGNNINKNTKTTMYEKKNYTHQSIHGSIFFWRLKPWCFSLHTYTSRGSSFPSMPCPP
jgi:hypothetical protein